MFRTTILALALSAASASLFSNNTGVMRETFDAFKRDHSKSYASQAEDAARFAIFAENMQIADARNVAERRAGGSAVHGVTRFSDLSADEFAARFLQSNVAARPAAVDRTIEPLAPGASASQDWSGVYTTAIKNQGYCGSCWAFSAVEQVESDAMRTLSKTYTLSPQQVVSCDHLESEGCNGGFSEDAYDYIKQAGGLVTESAYPYSTASSQRGISGTCDASKASSPVVTVDSYSTVHGESAMASYVGATGPLSVCLDASSWNSYRGGVMSVCGKSVDHCVQAVGIQTAEGYWKVRNSWGTTWGEDGYIRLAYGSNTCDITNDPTYTKVSLV